MQALIRAPWKHKAEILSSEFPSGCFICRTCSSQDCHVSSSVLRRSVLWNTYIHNVGQNFTKEISCILSSKSDIFIFLCYVIASNVWAFCQVKPLVTKRGRKEGRKLFPVTYRETCQRKWFDFLNSLQPREGDTCLWSHGSDLVIISLLV